MVGFAVLFAAAAAALPPGVPMTVTPQRRVLAPDVAEVLIVEIQNRSDKPVRVEVPSSGPCAVSAWVGLSVEPDATPRPVTGCTASTEKLEPWERRRFEVDVAELFDGLKPDHRLVVKHPKGNGSTIHEVFRREPVWKGKVERKGSIELPKGTFVFQGHGHKRTFVGQRSPLMVSGDWVADGNTESVSRNVQTSLSRQFEVGPYTFDLVDHSYDEHMELVVFETPSSVF